MLQSPHTAHSLVLGGASRAGRSKSQCRDGSPKQNRQILARASRAQATRWQYESQWVKWEKGDGVLGAVVNVRIVGVVGRQMDSLRQVRQENLARDNTAVESRLRCCRCHRWLRETGLLSSSRSSSRVEESVSGWLAEAKPTNPRQRPQGSTRGQAWLHGPRGQGDGVVSSQPYPSATLSS